MILLIFGIFLEVIFIYVCKLIFGYKAIVYSSFVICLVGLFVWVYYMFISGILFWMWMFFIIFILIVVVFIGIKIFSWIVIFWGGKICFISGMFFVVGLLVMFVMGGLSGVILGMVFFDVYVYDSYYVVGYFYYVLFGGLVFGLYLGIYYWFFKIIG